MKFRARLVADAPEDAAKEAEGAAHVVTREGHTAQREAQVVLVGGAHRGWRIAGGGHGFFDQAGEPVEILHDRMRVGRVGGRKAGGSIGGQNVIVAGEGRDAGGQLIEADGDRLAEVHRRLQGAGGDGNQLVAPGEILAREAVFFRAEDEGDAACAGQLLCNDGSERGQGDDRLLGLAAVDRAGAEHERRCCDGLGKGRGEPRRGEQKLGVDGRAGGAPGGVVGVDDGQSREAEVGAGAGRGADVERVARADENDVERGVLLFGGQENIVERGGRSVPLH